MHWRFLDILFNVWWSCANTQTTLIQPVTTNLLSHKEYWCFRVNPHGELPSSRSDLCAILRFFMKWPLWNRGEAAVSPHYTNTQSAVAYIWFLLLPSELEIFIIISCCGQGKIYLAECVQGILVSPCPCWSVSYSRSIRVTVEHLMRCWETFQSLMWRSRGPVIVQFNTSIRVGRGGILSLST